MEVASLWLQGQFNFTAIKPLIKIHIDSELYEVKTIESLSDFFQTVKLRYDVFFREFSTQNKNWLPYDIDMFDFICDHLIVKDKITGEVIACYRLLSTTRSGGIKKFYSENEFEISDFLSLKGNKLELGRACVHKKYRNGAVISLLWKGLIAYAKKTQTKYMFGCSSISGSDLDKLPEILNAIETQRGFIDDFAIEVHPSYKFEKKLRDDVPLREGKFIGSLMNMYMLAGAKFGKYPAFDSAMGCLDLFTIMDMENLPPSFERRFS